MSYLKPYLGNTWISQRAAEHVQSVVQSNAVFRYTPESKYCRTVEALACQALGVSHCLLVTNGTVALRAALLALRPQPGQLVFIPSITFIATANAVLNCGLVPVLVDVDEYGMLCPQALAKAIDLTPGRPLAAIAVHLEGASAQLPEILEVCQRAGLHLVEDCAQGMGTTYEGRSVGSFGAFGCFSFQANKLLSSGEGGLLVSTDSTLFRRACMLVDHGAERTAQGYPDWSQSIGFGDNGKFNEIQAALLIAQFQGLAQMCADLDAHYTELRDLFPDDAIVQRPAGSVPVSVWLKRSQLAPSLRDLPWLYDWRAWDMPAHPILGSRLSPYADGFPWRLLEQPLPDAQLNRHRPFLDERVCLPVPADDALFCVVRAEVAKRV